MTAQIGVNGFGRMGRLGVRVAWDWPDFEIVHVNEVKGGPAGAAHLLEFDSLHGRWAKDIQAAENAIHIGGERVAFSEHDSPGQVPWRQSEVDIVLECSGKFRTAESLQPYFEAGVKKVIVAAPVKEGALNLVVGCNDHLYDPAKHNLITAASCTTNCVTLFAGLGIQDFALVMLSLVQPTWVLPVSVAYVMIAQALSGVAKDLTKMSSKSAVKLLVKEGDQTLLFKWVALLTGSKNALKGLGVSAALERSWRRGSSATAGVQAFAPKLLRRSSGDGGAVRAAQVWGFVLAAVTDSIALALQLNFHPTVAVLGGLTLFAVAFAVNSSVHSYLILAYTDSDKVALNVGFYYMANAIRRLLGTLLSGLMYMLGGLAACLWVSTGLVLAAAGLTLFLPAIEFAPVER